MNRKLLNGLLVLAVAAGGVGTFTSCKDEGLGNDLQIAQIDLQAQIKALRSIDDEAFQTALLGWLNYLTRTDSGSNLNWTYEDFVKASTDMYDVYSAIKAGGDFDLLSADTQDYVNNLYNWMMVLGEDWYDQIYANTDAIEALRKLLGETEANFDGKIAGLEGNIASIFQQLGGMNSSLQNVIKDVSAVWVAVNANSSAIESNGQAIAANSAAIAANKALIESNAAKINSVKSELESKIADLEGKVDANASAITALHNLMQVYVQWLLANNADKVTSVGISQTYNPVLGTIDLPVGLNSMLFATYIYESKSENWDNETFPVDALSHLYDVSMYSDETLYDKNYLENIYNTVKNLSPKKAFTPVNGSFSDPASEDAGNMGRALVTINPTNLDFSAIQNNVQIINGKGEVVIDGAKGEVTLTPYNDDIYFGITRDGDNSNNGVYALGANATPENYELMELSLEDKKEFVSAVKDAIKDHSISDFAHLGNLIYEHMQSLMPAYAVRVGYDEVNATLNPATNQIETTTTRNYVVSDYKLASAVVHPFAYTTGLGFNVDKQLPMFSPISDYFNYYFGKLYDNIKIDLDGFGDYAQITPEDLHITITMDNVQISLAGLPVYNEQGEIIGYLGEDAVIELVFNDATGEYEHSGNMSGLISSIENAVNGQIGDYVDNIVEKVNNLITRINEDLSQLDAKVNEQLQSILDRIRDASKNKLKYADKLVSLYRKLAVRVNQALSNPNHYLQIMMAYNAGDGLHHLSNAKASPTKVSGTSEVGGEPGIELYVSSYNAELLVPSYKKYVAITNAWKNGRKCSTGEILALNNKAGGNLNTVLPGAEQRVALGVSELEGYTVELTYISLDYHGTCSFRQYYLYVED